MDVIIRFFTKSSSLVVKIMKVEEGTKIVSMAKVIKEEDGEEEKPAKKTKAASKENEDEQLSL